MEEEQGPVGISLDVILEGRDGGRGEWVHISADARICDYHVEMAYFLLFKNRRKIGCIFLVLGVVLGEDELAVRAFREAIEGLGGLVGRVTNGDNDGDGGAGEERAGEGSAKTLGNCQSGELGYDSSSIITPISASDKVTVFVMIVKLDAQSISHSDGYLLMDAC